MNENEKTAAHCKIGPSSLPARAICPCHEAAHGGMDAESGTRSHKVVEANIRNGQSCIPPDPEIIGVTESPEMMGMDPSSYYLPGTTDDEIGRGTWGAATILRLRDETAPGAYIYAETRVKYDQTENFDDDPPDEVAALNGKFGTVDAFWEKGDTLFVADYKTYANADSEKSYLPQGMMYAVLLNNSNGGAAYKNAVFFVVAAGDRTVERHEFTLDDAKRTVVGIIRNVESMRPGALFGTEEEARQKCGKPSAWCKYCAHSATCPAISRAVTMVNGGEILKKPLAVRMAIVPVLESFVKGVKAEVRARLDKGERVYDEASGIEYAFAMRRGRAKLKDLRGLAECVIVYGVKPDDFAAAVSVSKTAVDGLLKSVEEREGRKVKKAEREAVYLPYFTEPPMETYVKRVS